MEGEDPGLEDDDGPSEPEEVEEDRLSDDTDDESDTEGAFTELACDFHDTMMPHLHSLKAAEAAFNFMVQHCEKMAQLKQIGDVKGFKTTRRIYDSELPAIYISCRYQNRKTKELSRAYMNLREVPMKRFPLSRYWCLYQGATVKVSISHQMRALALLTDYICSFPMLGTCISRTTRRPRRSSNFPQMVSRRISLAQSSSTSSP